MSSKLCMFLLFALLVTLTLKVEAGKCKPSGKPRAKKRPPGTCTENDLCCIPGRPYPVYHCSPPVTNSTKATLTLNSFEKGGDRTSPSECDNQYHSDDTPVVALSTGWFSDRVRCYHMINIRANGKSVYARVVDQCDSTRGCDADHDYLPPCPYNVIDASKAVWKALDVKAEDWGELEVVWSDSNFD